MRNIALGALLLVLPFGGIRVMCFESAPAEGNPATAAEALSDCERMCPLHPPEDIAAAHGADSDADSDADSEADSGSGPDIQGDSHSVPASESESGCALSSGASTLTALGTIAVLRAEQVLAVPVSISIARIEAGGFYLEPLLVDLAPPPKSPAL